MDRRLADKIMLAIESAWDQGREEIAIRLGLIHETLLEEETVVRKRRRAEDDTFDAEDPDSFKRHGMYQIDGEVSADPESPQDAKGKE